MRSPQPVGRKGSPGAGELNESEGPVLVHVAELAGLPLRAFTSRVVEVGRGRRIDLCLTVDLLGLFPVYTWPSPMSTCRAVKG